jgi:hypothetical protein
MSLNYLENTSGNFFSIINPIAYENFSDLENQVLLNSVKDTIGSTIADTFNSLVGADIFDTDKGNAGTIIARITANILQQNNISEDTFNFYKFRINPQKFKLSRRKIIDEKLVGSGWDLDTINEEMISIGYEGTTGSLVPYNFFNKTVEPLLRSLLSQYGGIGTIGEIFDGYVDIPVLNRNPKLSASYIKFLNFEQFWKRNNNDLLFIWEDNCYLGKFTDFSYNLSEKEPYQIFWSFNIKVYPDFKYNLYTGWIDNDKYKDIQQLFNKRFKGTNQISSQSPNEINSVGRTPIGFESILTSTEETAVSWFEGLGKNLYNKNGALFLENSNLDKSFNLNDITPKRLAELYKQNSKIDLFEDSIEFNMHRPSIDIQSNNETEPIESSEPKDIKEEEIQSNRTENPNEK